MSVTLSAGGSAPGKAPGTAEDQLDPVANDHILARLIPQAKLVLYPDAGHRFLFQEVTPFFSSSSSNRS
jgi:hypothetical protein